MTTNNITKKDDGLNLTDLMGKYEDNQEEEYDK